ncbi:MAG: metallophosphoesterase [Holophagaceae bacterium]|nr:metallophosphoesterase [Holophagaceae bacterium]
MRRVLLSLILALAALVAVGLPSRARVDRPLTGLPLMNPKGNMEVALSLPFRVPGELREKMKSEGFTEVSWTLAGLNARSGIEAKSAKPRDPSGRWKVVHIADLPPPGRDDLLKIFIMRMSEVKPDLILATGDLGYGDTAADFDRITTFFRDLENDGAVVVASPGNHERKAWIHYLRHFGPDTWHRVEYGPFTILSLDSEHGRDQFTPAQFAWFKREIAESSGRTVLVQLHHPVFPSESASSGEAKGSGGFLGNRRNEFIKLCADTKVQAVLSGHWHSDAVFDSTGRLRDDTWDFPGTKFIVTTTLGNEIRRVTRWPKSYFGWRLLTFEDGNLLSYTADLDGDGKPDPIASEPLLPNAGGR